MHAIRLHQFGPPENLRYEELPDPSPGEDQVRIAVEAAGVHLIDTSIRAGRSGGPFPLPELPMTPGREVAGTVDGRRVVAHLGMASGGYAELALAPANALHDIPEGLAFSHAVAGTRPPRPPARGPPPRGGGCPGGGAAAPRRGVAGARGGGRPGPPFPAGRAPRRRVLDRRG